MRNKNRIKKQKQRRNLKNILTIILFLIIVNTTVAQIADTLAEARKNMIAKIDSVQLPALPDSLKRPWHKIDSVRQDFNTSADSLKQNYQSSIGALDAEISAVNQTLDSLTSLKLPSNKFTSRLDSLRAKREELNAEFRTQSEKLKSKTIGKLNNIEMTPGLQQHVAQLNNKINNLDITGNEFAKIPPMEVAGYTLPTTDGLLDLNKSGALSALPEVETPLGDLKEVTGELKGLQDDAKEIASGDFNNVEQLPESVEAQAQKIEGLSELQKQSGAIEEYKNKAGMLQDPKLIKQEATNTMQKQALNHFAGKSEQMKTAMDKISRYKQKYHSVQEIKDLPTRPINSMKDIPCAERLVPGMYLQFQSQKAWLLDLNPYAGYKVSGRITSGLGWNQRIVYDHRDRQWLPDLRIYGPRTFIDLRLSKDFVAHIEGEVMNAFVPSSLRSTQESGHREWVWGMQAGLKKQFTIYKNLKGTVLLQYNIFDRHFKSPYADRINSRMGFEYTLKKKTPLKR